MSYRTPTVLVGVMDGFGSAVVWRINLHFPWLFAECRSPLASPQSRACPPLILVIPPPFRRSRDGKERFSIRRLAADQSAFLCETLRSSVALCAALLPLLLLVFLALFFCQLWNL
jgi:hypothetical protein